MDNIALKGEELSGKVIGAAIEVHKNLGPGLLESIYEECLCYELDQIGLKYERQRPLDIKYKEHNLTCGYRMDIVIEEEILVELKSVETISSLHEAQLLTYLKLSNIKVGLIINFNAPTLKKGIKRMVL
ncbi:MAG: GxxExxY protein [Candidatus Cloacimonetes bacterium]|nr:GxxExxY protein [Candidatus Cloacimonadota bacterium]